MREGHHSVTSLLVSSKAELQMATSESAGMLCDFTQKGDIDKTTQLLDAGCPVNAADYDGRTALHLACSEGNLQIVTKLVERSAAQGRTVYEDRDEFMRRQQEAQDDMWGIKFEPL